MTARMKDIESDHNIYYCKADPRLGEETLARLQRSGVDTHSLAVDPLFVDPDRGDFRLRSNSPALKLGIVPIDLSTVGLRSDKK